MIESRLNEMFGLFKTSTKRKGIRTVKGVFKTDSIFRNSNIFDFAPERINIVAEGSVPETTAANIIDSRIDDGLKMNWVAIERKMMFKIKKIKDSFNAFDDNESNSLNLNVDVESNATKANVITANDINKEDGITKIG